MNLRIRTKQSPADEIRRLARRELGKAAAALAPSNRRSDRVHLVRKHVKKVRALLRLVEPHGDSKFVREENEALGELGRRLSSVRDAQVVIALLDTLRRKRNPRRMVLAVRDVQGALGDLTKGAVLADLSTKEAQACARDFKRRRRCVKRWPLEKLTWADLGAALVRSYQRGRGALEKYATRRTLHNLHQWRKRSKDFWYQLLILEALVPRELRNLAGKMEALTELQGAAHDLDLLLTALDRVREEISTADRIVIREHVQRRLRLLLARAFKGGRRIFHVLPERFGARLLARPK